jgi:uncharacterized membrane protein YcaP (DUF421 family)
MILASWTDILRVIVVGTLGYIALIFLLRISGKRTLSKMNMFDFVITIALGSTYASLILSKNVALAEGVIAFALLILLQFVVAWLSVRFPAFKKTVKGEPSLLFYRGQYMDKTLLTERIAHEEVRSAARAEGINRMEDLGAVVLETDGTFSVLPALDADNNSALESMPLPPGSYKDV